MAWRGLHEALVDLDSILIEGRAQIAAVGRARTFVERLENGGYEQPEIVVEPDGEIGFDWIVSQEVVITASLDRSGRLAYAWNHGRRRGRGVTHFHFELPEEFKEILKVALNQSSVA